MEALRTPKTAVKNQKIKGFGVSGPRPLGAPYFPTIRSSVFSSVGSAAWGEAEKFGNPLVSNNIHSASIIAASSVLLMTTAAENTPRVMASNSQATVMFENC